MEITVQILLGLVSLICLLGGLNLLRKGAFAFLPEGYPPVPVLDNLMRFLSGIYFSMGFLLIWVVYTIHEHSTLIYFLGFVVMFSGMGRLLSYVKVGSAGKYFVNIMWVEILLGVAIMASQFFR
ncbi:DUF4345 domain-containing protein [Chryseobacterium nematophagum]|uniref:DUF4345 domain-containing protein n=1 Tax=Chryseobacterium nematophagum TaxID=2305228 RepID=A0A3M7LAE7_9FLAO|nr:DUF4345 domain-containing protein [Chryseobacterium nematophagum]RMZ59751.1 DUF4345 domain-containing protein [Chryseobacterium nematophagum]